MVDLARQLGIQVAERVVREPGEVDDGVETVEQRGLDVAQVDPEGRNLDAVGEEVTALVVEAVEPDDVVAGLAEERHDQRADEAVVAGDEDLHPPSAVLAAASPAGVPMSWNVSESLTAAIVPPCASRSKYAPGSA